MPLSAIFARQLRRFREARGLSQDELSFRAGLDRTYISQLERGLKSPTLHTVEKLADQLGVTPAELVRERVVPVEAAVTAADSYLVSDTTDLTIRRADGTTAAVSAGIVLESVDVVHGLIDELYQYELDIAAVLGMRNLSAFVGELFASAIARTGGDLFRPNPHQDGYPDLLLMDRVGSQAWDELARRGLLGAKGPFSPFPGGGLEVKATCGGVPSPAVCAKRKISRPLLGDSRIGCLSKYDWKAHHRDTRNLIGVLWDFLGGRPRLSAVFYSHALDEGDWGDIVKPRSGGGKTTSVSIMRPGGIRKMYDGWLCVLRDGGYAEFLNRKNRGALIPTR